MANSAKGAAAHVTSLRDGVEKRSASWARDAVGSFGMNSQRKDLPTRPEATRGPFHGSDRTLFTRPALDFELTGMAQNIALA
jgi:hypothetical protein